MRRGALLIAGIVACAAAAPNAHAATVSVGSHGFGLDGLLFRAAPGEANDVRVSAEHDGPGDETLLVRIEDAVPIEPGAGCAADGAAVVCEVDSRGSRPGTSGACGLVVGLSGLPRAVRDLCEEPRGLPREASCQYFDNSRVMLQLGDGHDRLAASGDAAFLADGEDGDDALAGAGAARVHLLGGSGNDVLDGGPDEAVALPDLSGGCQSGFEGGDGDDVIRTGPRPGVAFGDGGRDHLIGGAHDDFLWGSGWYGGPDPSPDRVEGGGGGDVVWGGEGDDRVDGGSGNDDIHGNQPVFCEGGCLDTDPGNDHLIGGPGLDGMFGGPGRDRLDARDNTSDEVDCGEDSDVAAADVIDTVDGCERAA